MIRLAAAACLSLAATASAGPMTDWNLIVRNSIVSTSEVDGSALVGGSVLGTSNYSVQGVTASNGDGLAIGGDIGAGVNVQINNSGNLRISGSVNGIANVNGGVTISDPGVSAMVGAAFTQLENTSAYLAGLTPNGSMDGAGNLSAAPTMIGGQLVAVYNLTNADFNGLGQITLAMGGADSVIINVGADMSGVVNLVAPPNILSDFTQANSSRILWNFHDAATLQVNNSFNGAALAPFADLQLSGGGMNGSVVVDSISQMDAEIRRFTYTGFVPTPGAVALFALGGVAASRRRRAG